jgi:hypothetical protein
MIVGFNFIFYKQGLAAESNRANNTIKYDPFLNNFNLLLVRRYDPFFFFGRAPSDLDLYPNKV